MKKLLLTLFALILFVLILPASAFCQVGYCGLRYGENFAEARQTLEDKGFLMVFKRDVLRKFAIDPATDVYCVDLIMDPQTDTVAGWVVFFNENLSDEGQLAALEQLKALHGARFVEDPESGIIGAPLDNGRELSVSFDDDGDLALCIYFDAARNDLFNASAASNEEWRALAGKQQN